MANKDVTKALTTSDLTSAVTANSTAPVTSGGVFAKTRILNDNYRTMINTLLPNIKSTADAVSDYTVFTGNSQTSREGAWWGFRKTASYFTCLLITGGGELIKVLYDNGTYYASGII